MRCQCDSDSFECSNDAVRGSDLCDTCQRLCCPKRKTRYARVDVLFGSLAERHRSNVASYLPRNYEAVLAHAPDSGVVIVGYDDHGWTLEGYVIPRLASGLIAAYEVKQ